MKKLTLAAALVAAPFSVHAADLPSKKSAVMPVMAAPVFTWAGAYIGANVGADFNNDKTTYDYSYLPGNETNNFSDTFGNAADNSDGGSGFAGPANVDGLNAVQSAIADGIIPASLGSKTRAGLAGGLQLGYNFQTGNLVYGLEADLSWMAPGKTSSLTGTVSIPDEFYYTNTSVSKSSVNWLSTMRLRAGYAIDRLLVFGTGGLAFGGTHSSSSSVGTDHDITDTFAGSKSATRVGWAAGGGAEYAFNDHWVGRIEGIYYDLGKVSYAVSPQDINSEAEGLSPTASHRFNGTIARVGLSYKF